MKRVIISGIMLAAFTVGCMTTMVASDLLFPAANAQDVTKWEQLCKPITTKSMGLDVHADAINQELKTAGQNGWELVSHTFVNSRQSVICMKRQL